jgi:1-aminocyclopropane-1-carboxylate deaminase/D-cysteine desulfhydrase-like pyridoxal-dependent ACC family enzyme
MLLCYVILFDHYYLTIYFPQRYNWNIIESGVKHYNSNPNYLFAKLLNIEMTTTEAKVNKTNKQCLLLKVKTTRTSWQ